MTRIINPDDAGHINAIVDAIIDEHAKDKALHVVRKLHPDEVWFINALDYYDAVVKSPEGFLHRKHASAIMGMLNQCCDDTLRQASLPEEPVLGKKDNAKAVFAHLSRMLLKKRGVAEAARLLRN